ncbi:MAG: pantoate--beta-alanine ligase [Saprospiraceae bacterium]
MQKFVKVESLKNRISFLKHNFQTIGFVPTMGALHDGHISLLKESKLNNDITVCSIFVNPTQFNNPDDLLKYPKTIEEDIKKLKKVGTDILFLPNVKEIYPNGNTYIEQEVNLDGLDLLWEGEFRPGHFAGVVQVVQRLLNIVDPDNLYMGQKDFQQHVIINKMLQQLHSKTVLNVVPTKREKSGLAMSSRNVRLSEEERIKSLVLYDMLNFAKDHFVEMNVIDIENYAISKIKEKGLNPEYFKIVSDNNLKQFDNNSKGKPVAIVAAWMGNVRLIDNMYLN